jgi:hypothetical protein
MALGPAKYVLRFFCEWGNGCLWPENDVMHEDPDLGPYDCREPCPLPLSAEILRRCWELRQWHDGSLNWDYPPDPGPWRQEECERFNAAVFQLLDDLRRELGPEYLVLNQQRPLAEDPDLDAYLADPVGFRLRGAAE